MINFIVSYRPSAPHPGIVRIDQDASQIPADYHLIYKATTEDEALIAAAYVQGINRALGHNIAIKHLKYYLMMVPAITRPKPNKKHA